MSKEAYEYNQNRVLIIVNGDSFTSSWHCGALMKALENFLDKHEIFGKDREIAYDIYNYSDKEFCEKYNFKYIAGQTYFDKEKNKIKPEFYVDFYRGYTQSELRKLIKEIYPGFKVFYQVYEP